MRKHANEFEEWGATQEKEVEPCKLISIEKDPTSGFDNAKGTAEIQLDGKISRLSWSAKNIEGFWHTSLDSEQGDVTDLKDISSIENQINDIL